MSRAVLFLNGRYDSRHLSLFRKLCRGSFKVAVDGGFRFFERTGIVPDLLIGDFDSLRIPLGRVSRRTEILRHPEGKNKTDTHLALEECFRRKIMGIDMVQPSVGDTDHFLANLMLLERARKMVGHSSRTTVRLIGPQFEAQLVVDSKLSVKDRMGWGLSVVPLSDRIKYSCGGTKYSAKELSIARGETVSLRNRVLSRSAFVKVTGKAFVMLGRP